MRSFLSFVFVLILVALSVLFVNCGLGTETGNPKTEAQEEDGVESSAEEDEEQACLDAGGEWVEFSDDCGDSCESQRDEEFVCTQGFEFDCDCGDDMCWNGEECEEL